MIFFLLSALCFAEERQQQNKNKVLHCAALAVSFPLPGVLVSHQTIKTTPKPHHQSHKT